VSYLDYWAIIRRRWAIIAAIILLDIVASGLLYARANKAAGFQSCLTIYVADTSAPTTVAASSDLSASAELLAGESAANFFADDLNDVAQSRSVAKWISNIFFQHPNADYTPDHIYLDYAHVNGSISGSRQDRTDSLCVTNPNAGDATAIAKLLGKAMTTDRAQFVGKAMAKRTFVKVVSPPQTGPAPKSTKRLQLALQIILGILVAGGIALLWDALDPRVRDRHDLEAALGVPLLAGPA
jgi:capsular polysaccharide biosynthesis protein